MTEHILDQEMFPIVAWAGPEGDMIRDDVMAGMAEAGFTISHSAPHTTEDAIQKALDVAHKNGVKLLLIHPAYHAKSGTDFRLTQSRRREIARLVESVREHPGLYGYHLSDEPWFTLLPLLAELSDYMRSFDPCHLMYINLNSPYRPGMAFSPERYLMDYIRLVRPRVLSFDQYPIMVISGATAEQYRDLPNVFAEHRILVRSFLSEGSDPALFRDKGSFFAGLDMVRRLSSFHGLPFWAFTWSVPNGVRPSPTEGHVRFQLFNSLAYGAKGLQYFAYAHNEAMVRPDGSTTETWEIAKRVNAEIHGWAPILRRLRNVGVYHNGPLWSGMRPLPHPARGEHLSVDVEGDQATVGFFLDESDVPHLMVVNVNPCSERACITVKVNVRDEKLYLLEPSAAGGKALSANPSGKPLVLGPGEARLLRIGGNGPEQSS